MPSRVAGVGTGDTYSPPPLPEGRCLAHRRDDHTVAEDSAGGWQLCTVTDGRWATVAAWRLHGQAA